MREEQTVQVQDETGVERSPIILEEIVLSVTVPGQLLLAAGTQPCDVAFDDVPSAGNAGNRNALHRRRCRDGRHPCPMGKLAEEAR